MNNSKRATRNMQSYAKAIASYFGHKEPDYSDYEATRLYLSENAPIYQNREATPLMIESACDISDWLEIDKPNFKDFKETQAYITKWLPKFREVIIEFKQNEIIDRNERVNKAIRKFNNAKEPHEIENAALELEVISGKRVWGRAPEGTEERYYEDIEDIKMLGQDGVLSGDFIWNVFDKEERK